jgi:hypothetical protein
MSVVEEVVRKSMIIRPSGRSTREKLITNSSSENFMIEYFRGIQLGTYFKMEKDIRKEMEELSAQIAEEHYNITDGVDQNLHYLWYMYHKGSKAGMFRPFVYMAELQLLKHMGYINDVEIKNMIRMLESEDQDNLHMVTLSIKNFRELRLQEHGEYSKVNKAYWKYC